MLPRTCCHRSHCATTAAGCSARTAVGYWTTPVADRPSRSGTRCSPDTPICNGGWRRGSPSCARSVCSTARRRRCPTGIGGRWPGPTGNPSWPPLLADRRNQLQALLPATRRWAAELAASPIPLSVEHNDLHADNVFAGSASLPGLRIFDWGDATITHPFTGLRRALLTASGTDEEHPDTRPAPLDVDRLRDAYVAGWLTDRDTVPALRRDAELAGRLSWIVLAASWLRLPVGFDEEFAGYYAEILTGYLDAARIDRRRVRRHDRRRRAAASA